MLINITELLVSPLPGIDEIAALSFSSLSRVRFSLFPKGLKALLTSNLIFLIYTASKSYLIYSFSHITL